MSKCLKWRIVWSGHDVTRLGVVVTVEIRAKMLWKVAVRIEALRTSWKIEIGEIAIAHLLT
jgi:hypothetical protein